jgi:hypothetical protein
MAELFTLEEFPDLYLDACVYDEQHNLVFLSAWGRDTVLQEFLARLTLGKSEGGIDQFHISIAGHRLTVFPNTDLLEKRTTRQYPGTLFGSLLHVWLFDRRCTQPDVANYFAFALMGQDGDVHHRLWPLVIATCPLPLLTHWQRPVMDLLISLQMLKPLSGVLGNVCAWRLAIDIDTLEPALGTLIRNGSLTTASLT